MVQTLIRFAVAVLALMLVGYIVPGFSPLTITNALLAALAISVIAWGIEAIVGEDISPRSRGLVSFLVSAAVIWSVQYIVPAMSVTILGALLAALVIGLVDGVVPTTVR